MSEIRQIQLDGVNYDLVITEDEVAATRAEQAAQQATQQATYAGNYAVQAEDAADRAEQIVGGQFVSYGGNQGLSDTQKEQARKNIAAGGTNPNLLDNPFFIINQRGFTTSTETNNIFSVDRWLINNGGGTITKTANGIKINNTSGTRYNTFQQRFGADELAGKTVTLSIDTVDAIYKQTFTIPARTSSVQTMCNWAWKTGCNLRFYVETTSANASYNVQIYVANGYSTDLRAVKLELGTASTLANDVPPKEEQATADCKLYFQRIQQEDGYTAPVGFGIVAASTTILRTLIPLSSPLRKAGSLTATATNIGQMRVQGNGSNLTPTAITGCGVLNGHAIVDITVNGTLANNQFYTLVFANSTAIIDLSKEL